MEEKNNKISEEITNERAGNAAKVEQKKHKIRQKKILAELQKQVAFYFSEPNLQKDRFLRQRIAENDNGYVEVETIANFNRMKQLCSDISLIVKAMKLCPAVEVIDDKWVKPSQPLPEPKNVDSVTVYVERLPPDADHNWIKSIFSPCGNVVYISLPRYKTTRVIKQFAFVEFEKEDEAEAAIKMFAEKANDNGEDKDQNIVEGKMENDDERDKVHNKKNKKRKAKLSDLEHDDTKVKNQKSKRKNDDSCGDGSFTDISQGTDSSNGQKKIIDSNIEDENFQDISHEKAKGKKKQDSGLSASDNTVEGTNSVKRKRKRSEASDDGDTSSKKNKQYQESDDEDIKLGENEEASAQDGADELKVGKDDKKKKKRKRKKKEKQETEVPQLRVISKKEWLNMKKEYQKLQRQAMKDAKQELRIDFEVKVEKSKEDKADTLEGNENITNNKKREPPQKLEMQPGVVLRFSCDENTDKRKLKNIFSMTAPVAYIEKEDNLNTGYVRFATKEACDKVVETFSASGSLGNVQIEKLTESEDVEYWKRLNSDRFERLQHGTQRNRNRRGRQKITKKIDERNAKKRDHIHFED